MIELRASKIGGCIRKYVMELRSGKEAELTPRQRLYFAVGKALEPIIMEHAGYDPGLLLNDTVKVEIPLNGNLVLTGHPDAEDDDWIYECKTMRSFAYRKVLENGIENQFPQYLVQGSIYRVGRGKRGVKFLCLDKDASYIQEIPMLAEALEPYFQQAVANAKKVDSWLPKVNLPGKPKEQPYWYCLEAYCGQVECRYHHLRTQERNMQWVRKRNI